MPTLQRQPIADDLKDILEIVAKEPEGSELVGNGRTASGGYFHRVCFLYDPSCDSDPPPLKAMERVRLAWVASLRHEEPFTQPYWVNGKGQMIPMMYYDSFIQQAGYNDYEAGYVPGMVKLLTEAAATFATCDRPGLQAAVPLIEAAIARLAGDSVKSQKLE